MCHAPHHNSEPVIAIIKIYICVTFIKKKTHLLPLVLQQAQKNYKFLYPCSTPTWVCAQRREELASMGSALRGALWTHESRILYRRQLRLRSQGPTFWGPSSRSRHETKLWPKIYRRKETLKV